MTTDRDVAATTHGAGPQAPARPVVVRRFGRRVYQVGAVTGLVAAVQAAILGAVGPARWPGLVAAAVLAAGAVTLVVKSIPYDHVRFRP